MKSICPILTLIFLLTAVVLFSALSPAQANPFTGKADPAPVQMAPRAAVPWMQKLIHQQQVLRQTISQKMRQAKARNSVLPLAAALAAALAYGMLHSAGPGHGKAVALSYIISTRPGYLRALAFGNILAFTHGLSGIVLVLAVKWVLHTGFQSSLNTITLYTQRVSFGLILVLGLYILFTLVKKQLHSRGGDIREAVPPVPAGLSTAFVMGMIPCPGVVMVMLFSMSMGVTAFGILMGLTISLGMAVTLSMVTMAGVLGKNTLISGASRFESIAKWEELIIEGLAALALVLLGSLFLAATL